MTGSTMCRYLQGGAVCYMQSCSSAMRRRVAYMERQRQREREDIGCKWKGSAIGTNLRSDGERSSILFAAVLGVYCNLQYKMKIWDSVPIEKDWAVESTKQLVDTDL